MSRALVAAVLSALLAGCVSAPGGRWGADVAWPEGERLRHAAARAARDPHTWLPLAGAALLGIGNADEAVSEWAVDETPLFGDDAADASDVLLDVAKGSYVVTALFAPSPSFADKLKGLAVGAVTLAANENVTRAIKSATSRQRPDRRDDKSFPSGHASSASTAATLAAANLEYFDLAPGMRRGLVFGAHAVAGATAWARVEAERHHVTDVLAGYALGHFIATFAQEAFFGAARVDTAVAVIPLSGGAAVTVRLPLGR